MLEEFEADVALLRSRIDEADAAYRHGEFRKSPGAEAMKADIISRGEARLRRRSFTITGPADADLDEIFEFIARVAERETIILHVVHSARDVGRLTFDHDEERS